MDVSVFKAVMTGFASPARFDITISGAYVQAIDQSMLKVSCKAASLPSSTLGVIEVPYFGRKVKIPGDRTYSEWSTTLIADNAWTVYQQLLSWHESINSPSGNTAVTANVNDFKADGLVTAYDAAGNITIQKKLVGLWPSEVSQVEFAWDSTDQTADIPVTWAYDYSESV